MPWIHLCFFLSGATSLVYEVLWTRMLGQIIGAAPYAVSMVLAVFMGGLGLGAMAGGRLADGETGPGGLLRLYGRLEIAIGAYALALPFLIREALPFCAQLYRRYHGDPLAYHSLLFLLCALLLLPPVLCMGATLPILGRRVARQGGHWTARLGLLYGLNTAGAAMGALVCGFWLLENLGQRGTAAAAASVNILIGALCAFLPRREQAHGAAVADFPESDAAAGRSATAAGSGYPIALALGIFALSGFCAMACEVIWARLLGLVLGPTPYAFTLVLSTFILGLALGNMVFARLADRGRDPWMLFASTQAAAAGLILLSSQLLGNSPLFFSKLAVTFRHGFWTGRALEAAALSMFMFPPAIALGAAFPLIVRMGFPTRGRSGSYLGRAYAANTAGGVLGSLAAGFLMIPWLGKEGGLGLVAGLQGAGALALALTRLPAPVPEKRRVWKPLFAACLAVAAIVLAAFLPKWDRSALSRSAYYDAAPSLLRYGWLEALLRPRRAPAGPSGGEEVYYGDGIGGFTTVWKTTGPLGDEDFTLFNSGKADASAQADMFTQSLCAHFPMIFHPDPRRVMVLGLASGITAGEVLLYPVDSLDILEINRQVPEASRFFARWNNNALDHPRTRLILEDGKAHLSLTDRIYDVIISEPSNPWMAGLAQLYSLDFFETARSRLAPGGIFVQFLHSYQMDWSTFALVGRTFAKAFPNGMLVRTLPSPSGEGGAASDFLLVGFNGAALLDEAAARRHLPHARRSRNVSLAGPDVLFRLVESDDPASLFGPGPIHTDDVPLLEFAAPRLIYTDRGGAIRDRIRERPSLSPALRLALARAEASVDAQIDFAAYALSLFRPYPGMVDLARADSGQRARFLALVENYCGANSISDFSPFTPEPARRGCVARQVEALQARMASGPGKARAVLGMAALYDHAGVRDRAVPLYRLAMEAGGFDPGLVETARRRLERLAADGPHGASDSSPTD